MKLVRLPLSLGCLLATATWADPVHACEGAYVAAGPSAFEAFVILLAVFGIGTSAAIALGRGSATLRSLALRTPSRGLKVSAVVATAGFAATTAFIVGLAVLLSALVFV